MSQPWRLFHYYAACAAMYIPLRLLADVPWGIAIVVAVAFGFVWEWQAVDINKRLKARNERIERERQERRG